MLPRLVRPARSTSRGSRANVDGGKPRVVGGSPAARPISRWARANRVIESITKQHVLARVAKVLGDRRRGVGGLHAQQRRLVARGHDDDAPRQALGAQLALDEFVDFAAALADQGDHGHVGLRVAGHHAHEHALADAGAGEDSQPLPAAAGEHAVDRRTPVPSGASIRGRSVAGDRGVLQAAAARRASGCGRPSMHCPRASITRPSRSRTDLERARRADQPHRAAAAHAVEIAQRHHQRAARRESR